MMIVDKKHTPPTQADFVNGYLSNYPTVYTTAEEEALIARLCRAYPSFVREDYFYSLVQYERPQWLITRSHSLDFKHGIDFLIISEDNIGVKVDLGYSLERSYKYKEKKRKEHNDNSTVSIHRFKAQIGPFYLPNINNIKFLEGVMNGYRKDIAETFNATIRNSGVQTRSYAE
jgi:hypothetical protein